MSEMQTETAPSAAACEVPLRTYIAVVFWGEEFRRYFLDYCLASLMSPGNIPAIQNKSSARLLIATRSDDWEAMQSEPIFIAAKKHIAVEHVPHEAPLKVPPDKKMWIMSQGHKLVTRRLFEDRAHCVMAYPDAVFADGAIGRIEQLALQGYKVVLCIAVRFSNEGLSDELKRSGLVKRGVPIDIGTKDLVRLTIKHLHSEAVRLDFESDLDDQGACSFFWVVSPGQDLLFHCVNWAPVLIDYSALSDHDDSTFDNWTFDGDYVARNFSNVNDVYVVRNTSELFLTSFTPESKVSYPLVRLFPYRFAALRRILKIARAHANAKRLNTFDALKKQCFRIPIRVQGGDAQELAWREAEQRAGKVVARILEPDNAVKRWLRVIPLLTLISRLRRSPYIIRNLARQRRDRFLATRSAEQ
jgi:hypothetical protein